jgi:Protein of unknown function (DUF1579)
MAIAAYRRSVCAFAVVCLLSLAAGRAVGQEQDFIIQPTTEHELLKKDVGTWDAVVKVWPMEDADPMESKGTETNELLKGGLWLVSRFEGEAAGMPFVGVGTSGYDPVEKKYVGTWIDTMTPHLMTTKSEYDADSKTMTGTAEGRDAHSGAEYTAKIVHRYENDNSRVFEMHMPGENGKHWKMLEIRYERSDE